MNKRRERELFFKTVFILDFFDNKIEVRENIENFLISEGCKNLEKFLSRTDNIMAKLSDIDNFINSITCGWKTSRMSKVDLALLRVAVYEINYENLSMGIAINEVVELAKVYGGERSFAFINGVLGKVST